MKDLDKDDQNQTKDKTIPITRLCGGYRPPFVCTALYVHCLVYARTCTWTTRLVSSPFPHPVRHVSAPNPPSCAPP